LSDDVRVVNSDATDVTCGAEISCPFGTLDFINGLQLGFVLVNL